MRLRPEVRRFAEMMESALRAHDKDRGTSWKTVPVQSLVEGQMQEQRELDSAVRLHFFDSDPPHQLRNIRREDVLKECADVGNFCMFLADRAGLMRWSPRMSSLTDEEKDWAAIEWAENNLEHLDGTTREIVLAYSRTLRRKTPGHQAQKGS